jgi:hypothetical protein
MLQLNPILTEEQRKVVEAKIEHLRKWVNGELEPGPAPVLVTPKTIVEEKMVVEEGVVVKKRAKTAGS